MPSRGPISARAISAGSVQGRSAVAPGHLARPVVRGSGTVVVSGSIAASLKRPTAISYAVGPRAAGGGAISTTSLSRGPISASSGSVRLAAPSSPGVLNRPTLRGSGWIKVQGASTITLSRPVEHAAGQGPATKHTTAGAGPISTAPLSRAAITAAASSTNSGASGSASASLPRPRIAGLSRVGERGLVAATIAAPTIAAVGRRGVSVSGSATLPKPTPTAVGLVNGRTITGRVTLARPTAFGIAARGESVSGGPALARPSVSGSGRMVPGGSGAATLPRPLASGASLIWAIGTASASLPRPSVSGAASQVRGSAAAAFVRPTLSGSGRRGVGGQATGQLRLPKVEVGTGWVSLPDPNARPSDGHPNALDFLPPGIAAKPLYTFLGPLIDYALTPGSGVNEAVLDDLVGELSLTYADVEAVNAYVNLFLRPVVGTRSVMDYAFQLLGVSPHLVEWFQPRPQEPGETVAPTGPSDKPYRFGVTFDMDTLPKGPFEYGALIRLLLVLKNERSRLMSVRMIDCVDELTLDNDCEVDKYWLDSIEGFVDPASGVTICLHDNFAQEVTEQTHTTVVARTSRLAETTLGFQFGMLDFTALDTDTVFDCGSWTPNQARTWDWVRREIYCPQSLDFVTGAMLYFQGRTSDRAISVTGDQPAPHPVRTWIFDQAITVSLSPAVNQTLSVRLDTRAVPRAAMYSPPAWSDQPDGYTLSWSDQQPRSWQGEQPQTYQTHSQEIQSGYFFASASPRLGGLAASGIGKHGVSGKAAATQPRPIVVVVDNVAPAGPARASLPRPAAHASGVTGPSARGVLTVKRPVVAGVAERVPIGAAFVFLPRPLVNATG